MCQSQQFVTWDPSFCHPGSNFPGKKIKNPSIVENVFFTGAQPKAGTGHKMQSISVVSSTLHCEGYIADLTYRWLITSRSARWLIEIYPPFWKARGMEDSQQKDSMP